MTISERTEAGRRERRVLARVSRAAWRLEQAERERTWALVSARPEGISIRTLTTAIGLSPSRVHQTIADADPDALDAALGELRAAGWEPSRSSRPRMSGCLMGKQPLSFGILTFNAEADRRARGDGQAGCASGEQGEHDIAAQPTAAAVCTIGLR